MSSENQQEVNQTIEVMRPKASPFPLINIGGFQDGGYLLPKDLDGIRACFSPGVQNRKDFEDELSDKYGVATHMCDFSSELNSFRTPLRQNQTFKKKWLDVNGSENSVSLDEWVMEMSPEQGDDLLLQMDIEGAEYRNLLSASHDILRRFRIIVIELHDLTVCNKPNKFKEELGPLLKLLDLYFICVHAHPNNCGGEFALKDSDLNLPKVHELTFLRRDRFEGIVDAKFYPPMIPHPLDVRRNYTKKAPIFLNESWLLTKKRAPESTIKILEEEIAFLKSKLETSSQNSVERQLYALAKYAASYEPESTERPSANELGVLSENCSFTLSSTHRASPRLKGVTECAPFFFHTKLGRNEFITIDLDSECQLFELRISNRLNGFGERACDLFYHVHSSPKPNLNCGLPVSVTDNFLRGESKSITDLRGQKARYISIFSPSHTALHFTNIEVLGMPVPGERAKQISNSISKVEKLIVIPKSGLANKLMALLSCWRIADRLDSKFGVYWKSSEALHADFVDLFTNDLVCSSLPKVNVIHRDSASIQSVGADGGRLQLEELDQTMVVESNAFLALFDEPRGESFLKFGPLGDQMRDYFRRLKPVRSISEFADRFSLENNLESADALHIRWGVGDSAMWQAKHQRFGLDPYLAAIEKRISCDETNTILVVSDSPEVRLELKNTFADKIVLSPALDFNRTNSVSAARDSLLDFILLTRCRSVTSKDSSFSYLAAFLAGSEYNRV